MVAPLYIRGNSQDLYAQALSTLYYPGQRLYDPDFALFSDADIYAKVHRDAEIKHAMALRKHLVATKQWSLMPADESFEAKLAASIVEAMFKKIRKFSDSMLHLSEAIFRGSAWLRIRSARPQGGIDFGGIGPRNWRYPYFLKEVDRRRFRYMVDNVEDNEKQRTVRLERSNLSFEWKTVNPNLYIKHVYDDSEERLGYGRGLLEAIYFLHYSKIILMNEGLAAAERWGQGLMRVGITRMREASKTKATNRVISDYLSVMEKTKSRHILAHDKEDDLEMMHGSGEGHQIITAMLQYCDNAITTLILGGTTPTTGGDQRGSYALAQVQEDSRDAIIAYDRQVLAETITTELIEHFIWAYNKPIFAMLGIHQEHLPKFLISPKAKVEPDKAAVYIGSILSAGIPLKKQEVYERLGFSQPKDEDEVIEGAQAQQQQAMPGGFGDLGAAPDLSGLLQAKDVKCGMRSCLKDEHGNYSCDLNDKRLSYCGEHECKAKYEQGQPCKKGETAAKSRCVPDEHEGDESTRELRKKRAEERARETEPVGVGPKPVDKPGELLPPREEFERRLKELSTQKPKAETDKKPLAENPVTKPKPSVQSKPVKKEPVAKIKNDIATKVKEKMGNKQAHPDAIEKAVDAFVRSAIQRSIPIDVDKIAEAVHGWLDKGLQQGGNNVPV